MSETRSYKSTRGCQSVPNIWQHSWEWDNIKLVRAHQEKRRQHLKKNDKNGCTREEIKGATYTKTVQKQHENREQIVTSDMTENRRHCNVQDNEMVKTDPQRWSLKVTKYTLVTYCSMMLSFSLIMSSATALTMSSLCWSDSRPRLADWPVMLAVLGSPGSEYRDWRKHQAYNT